MTSRFDAHRIKLLCRSGPLVGGADQCRVLRLEDGDLVHGVLAAVLAVLVVAADAGAVAAGLVVGLVQPPGLGQLGRLLDLHLAGERVAVDVVVLDLDLHALRSCIWSMVSRVMASITGATRSRQRG